MKTVRTRVKTAFRRNSKGVVISSEPVPLKLPPASTSAPSVLSVHDKAAPTPPVSPATPLEKEIPLSPSLDPQTGPPLAERQTEKPEVPNITELTLIGDEPEQIHVPPQSTVVKDDSRKSTPRKRIKSVPRASSDSQFPSPSIASRIQTPPPTDKAEEIKFVSPVDPNYLIDDNQIAEPQILDQPEPTDSSFAELTSKEVPLAVPPLHEVLAHHGNLKRVRSDSIKGARPASLHETLNEERPLLDPSILSAEVDDILDSVWPLPSPSFGALGWTEHVLPSSAYYYSHAATRTVTDIDLRDEKKLAAVKSYLRSKSSSSNEDGPSDNPFRDLRNDAISRIEEGVDLWLRDANSGLQTKNNSEWQFVPMRNWVLHATRAVTFDPPSEHGGYRHVDELNDEDRLDLENRYWLYMSTHPAHASLPQTAYEEALEVVVWCYADRVLRTPQPPSAVPPFTQRECVEYLELLRNVAGPISPGTSSAARTRVVAQVLLRYTEWRQKYIVRLNDKNTASSSKNIREKVEYAIPFRKTLLRFVKAVLCLGLPYLFESRNYDMEKWTSARRIDEEEQGEEKHSNAGEPGLGSSQILVAALLLSASVTFLALPDLHGASRGAALIAALCSSASLVSYVITLRPRARRHGNQDPRSRNSILVALPLVMLAYSLCALVGGIIAYSLAGTVVSDRSSGFGRPTGWVVIAVSATLAAVLAWSAVAAKKGP